MLNIQLLTWRFVFAGAVRKVVRPLQSRKQNPKAPEPQRAPKRRRKPNVENGGHILDCGAVTPLFARSKVAPWLPNLAA